MGSRIISRTDKDQLIMMTRILVENIIVPHKAGQSADFADNTAISSAAKKIKKQFGVSTKNCVIHRKSVDARKKAAIKLVYSVCADIPLDSADAEAKLETGFKLYSEGSFEVVFGTDKLNSRPVIAGFGPAGIFCALALAERGYRPIVYERGGNVKSRIEAVERFKLTGRLDVNTNIQFGAGGAGTFSDGKLTTRINDPLCAYVLKKLVELGAPEDITTKAKPHIGTDILIRVVENAEEKLKLLGGEVIYNSKIEISGDEAYVHGEKIDYGVLVLSVGHSARDTYAELLASGYAVEPKAFSVGVRIEHLQSELDRAMLGDFAGDKTIGHAEYGLSHRRGDRGVYSFCMCPGGEVVPAASEEGGVVTNGMSRRLRDGVNSNAAIAVSVKHEDYGATPSGAIAFQRELESRAFAAGGKTYAAPMQTVGDFLNGQHGTQASRIVPSYMNGNVVPSDMRGILPAFVCGMLDEGLRAFGKKIAGFDADDVPMTGVETRTSAPVRIMRGDGLTAFAHERIYPCGEGAGYAGGIMSAAIDGLRVARAVMEKYAPLD